MYKLWIEIRSSLWFVPALLILGAMGLGIGLVQLDISHGANWKLEKHNAFFGVGASGSRAMLSAIASSMITVAGVAFSVTIVTLSLGSSQYTPRILRNFMRDRWNQFVLGMFVAIFAYCLVVMRTIRAGDENGASFVPVVAVFVGVLLALSSIACLIFFIHHTATSIQASTLLAAINEETLAAIACILPEESSDAPETTGTLCPVPQNGSWVPVMSGATGYVQNFNPAALLRLASKEEIILRVEQSVGEFATAGVPLISADRELDEAVRDRLRRLFTIGEFRVITNDPEFGVRQIVDIAVKALSPGVNDTSTAATCIDYLGSILSFVASRRAASSFRTDDKGAVRLIAPTLDFATLVAKAFDEIRLSAAGNVTILVQMLAVIGRIADATRRPARKQVALDYARLVVNAADRTVETRYDRLRVNERIVRIRPALDADARDLPEISAEQARPERAS